MKISKDAMIYRSYMFLDNFFPSDYKCWMPKNLCQFMRAYIMRFIFFAFIVYIIAGGFIGLPFFFLSDVMIDAPLILAIPAIFIVSSVVGLLFVATLFILIKAVDNMTSVNISIPNSAEIILEYVKSKVRRYCIPIEYEE